MNHPNPSVEEENIRRLLTAAQGPQARPSVEARQQALTALTQAVRSRRTGMDFPLPVLGMSALTLGAMGAWIAFIPEVQTGIGAGWVAMLLGLNLLWIPISSFIIVKRRRIHD
jgi:hypothetical protein